MTYKTFTFERFKDLQPGYTTAYSPASPYDRQAISDMEYAECWFEDTLPDQRIDMFYPKFPQIRILTIS